MGNWTYEPQQSKLVAHEINADLNVPLSLEWVGGLDADLQVDQVWLGTGKDTNFTGKTE